MKPPVGPQQREGGERRGLAHLAEAGELTAKLRSGDPATAAPGDQNLVLALRRRIEHGTVADGAGSIASRPTQKRCHLGTGEVLLVVA
jgi:hypothetical protein